MAFRLASEGDKADKAFSEKDYKDKRSQVRRRMNKFLRVMDRSTGHVLGRVMDMTSNGMMIVSAQGLQDNETLSLSLILPADFETAEKVDFDACVVWANSSGYSSNIATGMKITNISKENSELICRLLKD